MQVDTDILYPALRLARVLTGPQRTPSASEKTDAFQALNRMIDAWTGERLMIFTIRIDRYSLDSSQLSYTIGPGGDFDAVRPIRITAANIVLTGGATEVRVPLALLTDRDWSSKRLREVPTTVPTELYNDGGYPLSTLYLWGFPTSGNDLELFTWQQLTQFATQADAVIFPPSYHDAVVYGLAVRLTGIFNTALRPDVAQIARESKARVKAGNASSPRIPSADFGTSGRRVLGGLFNYLTGK